MFEFKDLIIETPATTQSDSVPGVANVAFVARIRSQVDSDSNLDLGVAKRGILKA